MGASGRRRGRGSSCAHLPTKVCVTCHYHGGQEAVGSVTLASRHRIIGVTHRQAGLHSVQPLSEVGEAPGAALWERLPYSPVFYSRWSPPPQEIGGKGGSRDADRRVASSEHRENGGLPFLLKAILEVTLPPAPTASHPEPQRRPRVQARQQAAHERISRWFEDLGVLSRGDTHRAPQGGMEVGRKCGPRTDWDSEQWLPGPLLPLDSWA